MEIERLKNELSNVDLSGFKAKRMEMHPKSEQLLEFCENYFGDDFDLIGVDLAKAFFYSFPLIQNIDVANCCLLFIVAAFQLDDYLDRNPDDCKKWVQYLRTKQFPEKGKMSKWQERFVNFAKEAIGEIASNEVIEHYAFALSLVPEKISICTGKTTPTCKEYIDIRLIDVGVWEILYFQQVDSGVKMTDELRNDPDFIGLQHQVILQVAIVNDSFSLRKEVTENEYKFNYVYVKMVNENISAQRAIDDIVIEAEEAAKMAQIHGENLKKRNEPNLSLYVDGAYAVMHGALYWSSTCKRYNK